MKNSEILYLEKIFEHGRKIRTIYILTQTEQNIRQIYDFLEQNHVKVLINVGQNNLQEKQKKILYEQLDSQLDKYLIVAKDMHNQLFKNHNDVAIISGQSLNNSIKLYLLFMKIFEGISSENYTEHSKKLNISEVLDLKNFIDKHLYNQQYDNNRNNDKDKILLTQEQAISQYLESPIDQSNILISNVQVNNSKKIRIISEGNLDDYRNQQKLVAPNPQQHSSVLSSSNSDDTYGLFMPPRICNEFFLNSHSDQIDVSQSKSINQELNNSKVQLPNLPQPQRLNTFEDEQPDGKQLGQSMITADESKSAQQIQEQVVYQIPQPIIFEVFRPKTNLSGLKV